MYYLNTAFEPLYVRKLYEFPNYYEPIKYSFISRYGNTKLILDKETNVYFHETVSNYKIEPSANDEYMTITDPSNRRLDSIANMVYGSSLYWWVIAMANNIIDAFEELEMGTVLRLPKLMEVYSRGNVLSTKENN